MYIEREALLEEVSSLTITINGMRAGKSILYEALTAYRKAVVSEIENAPAADVAPVVHGRWVDAEDGDGVVCSRCGEDFCVLTNENERFIYCPNCGAKMDK